MKKYLQANFSKITNIIYLSFHDKLLHITEIISEVLLLVTERRDPFHHKRNDSIYDSNKGYDSREFLVAKKVIFNLM